jgi:hypothetical protein
MNLKQIIAPMLVAIAISASHVALGEKSSLRRQERIGTIAGRVVGVDEDRPRAATVVIESNGKTTELETDEQGRFSTTAPAGVYVAYVKPSFVPDRKIVHAPFWVRPGQTVEMELDRMSPYVYCTMDGQRVIPLSTGGNDNLKNLSSPKYDEFQVTSPDGPTLKIVIEYCGKTTSNRATHYKSARMDYDTTRIFADAPVFDSYKPGAFTFESNTGPVEVTQHGSRKEEPRIFAHLTEGKLALYFSDVASVRGTGEIESGGAIFNFEIDRNRIPSFHYTDKKKGLTLVSRKHDCLSVTRKSDGSVTFSGLAVATRQRVLGGLKTEKTVEYTVTVRDFGHQYPSKDHFSIRIPTENYRERGQVLRGDISILPAPKGTHGVAKLP